MRCYKSIFLQRYQSNNLNEFLDLAEKNYKIITNRTPVSDVIDDSQLDKCAFILDGEFLINDVEPFQVNRFYKDSD